MEYELLYSGIFSEEYASVEVLFLGKSQNQNCSKISLQDLSTLLKGYNDVSLLNFFSKRGIIPEANTPSISCVKPNVRHASLL